VYGRTSCNKDDQFPSPLTLHCSIKQTLINRCCLVGQSPLSAVANYLTIRHKQQKSLFCSKAQKRHNDAALALALALALSLLIAVAIRLNGSDKLNKIRSAMIAG
jgi:hypothetical protein